MDSIYRPKKAYQLIRIGKNNDGGYLVEHKSVLNTSVLISMGISADWSFEKNFYRLNKIPISTFDASLNNLFWNSRIKKSFLKFLKLSFFSFFKDIYLYIDYKFFFKKDIKHHAINIGNHTNQLSYLEIIKEIKEDKKIFLKIDIEGGEYEILEDILKYQEKLEGLVIEFHNIQKNNLSIINFIKKINLEIVHIHPNNYSGVDGNLDPIDIEMSFAKEPKSISDINTLPHKLDQKNYKRKEDISIKFITNNY